MIEYQVTTGQSTIVDSHTLGFLEAMKEACKQNLFKERGDINNPFNLDSFIKWGEHVNPMMQINPGQGLSMRFSNPLGLKEVKLIQAHLIKLTEPKTIWKRTGTTPENEQWSHYFDWNEELLDAIFLPTGELIFDLSNVPNEIDIFTNFISRTSNRVDNNIYFSFGFIFSFEIEYINEDKETIKKTVYGQVDPLLKISTGN